MVELSNIADVVGRDVVHYINIFIRLVIASVIIYLISERLPDHGDVGNSMYFNLLLLLLIYLILVHIQFNWRDYYIKDFLMKGYPEEPISHVLTCAKDKVTEPPDSCNDSYSLINNVTLVFEEKFIKQFDILINQNPQKPSPYWWKLWVFIGTFIGITYYRGLSYTPILLLYFVPYAGLAGILYQILYTTEYSPLNFIFGKKDDNDIAPELFNENMDGNNILSGLTDRYFLMYMILLLLVFFIVIIRFTTTTDIDSSEFVFPIPISNIQGNIGYYITMAAIIILFINFSGDFINSLRLISDKDSTFSCPKTYEINASGIKKIVSNTSNGSGIYMEDDGNCLMPDEIIDTPICRTGQILTCEKYMEESDDSSILNKFPGCYMNKDRDTGIFKEVSDLKSEINHTNDIGSDIERDVKATYLRNAKIVIETQSDGTYKISEHSKVNISPECENSINTWLSSKTSELNINDITTINSLNQTDFNIVKCQTNQYFNDESGCMDCPENYGQNIIGNKRYCDPNFSEFIASEVGMSDQYDTGTDPVDRVIDREYSDLEVYRYFNGQKDMINPDTLAAIEAADITDYSKHVTPIYRENLAIGGEIDDHIILEINKSDADNMNITVDNTVINDDSSVSGMVIDRIDEGDITKLILQGKNLDFTPTSKIKLIDGEPQSGISIIKIHRDNFFKCDGKKQGDDIDTHLNSIVEHCMGSDGIENGICNIDCYQTVSKLAGDDYYLQNFTNPISATRLCNMLSSDPTNECKTAQSTCLEQLWNHELSDDSSSNICTVRGDTDDSFKCNNKENIRSIFSMIDTPQPLPYDFVNMTPKPEGLKNRPYFTSENHGNLMFISECARTNPTDNQIYDEDSGTYSDALVPGCSLGTKYKTPTNCETKGNWDSDSSKCDIIDRAGLGGLTGMDQCEREPGRWDLNAGGTKYMKERCHPGRNLYSFSEIKNLCDWRWGGMEGYDDEGSLAEEKKCNASLILNAIPNSLRDTEYETPYTGTKMDFYSEASIIPGLQNNPGSATVLRSKGGRLGSAFNTMSGNDPNWLGVWDSGYPYLDPYLESSQRCEPIDTIVGRTLSVAEDQGGDVVIEYEWPDGSVFSSDIPGGLRGVFTFAEGTVAQPVCIDPTGSSYYGNTATCINGSFTPQLNCSCATPQDLVNRKEQYISACGGTEGSLIPGTCSSACEEEVSSFLNDCKDNMDLIPTDLQNLQNFYTGECRPPAEEPGSTIKPYIKPKQKCCNGCLINNSDDFECLSLSSGHGNIGLRECLDLNGSYYGTENSSDYDNHYCEVMEDSNFTSPPKDPSPIIGYGKCFEVDLEKTYEVDVEINNNIFTEDNYDTTWKYTVRGTCGKAEDYMRAGYSNSGSSPQEVVSPGGYLSGNAIPNNGNPLDRFHCSPGSAGYNGRCAFISRRVTASTDNGGTNGGYESPYRRFNHWPGRDNTEGTGGHIDVRQIYNGRYVMSAPDPTVDSGTNLPEWYSSHEKFDPQEAETYPDNGRYFYIYPERAARDDSGTEGCAWSGHGSDWWLDKGSDNYEDWEQVIGDDRFAGCVINDGGYTAPNQKIRTMPFNSSVNASQSFWSSHIFYAMAGSRAFFTPPPGSHGLSNHHPGYPTSALCRGYPNDAFGPGHSNEKYGDQRVEGRGPDADQLENCCSSQALGFPVNTGTPDNIKPFNPFNDAAGTVLDYRDAIEDQWYDISNGQCEVILPGTQKFTTAIDWAQNQALAPPFVNKTGDTEDQDIYPMGITASDVIVASSEGGPSPESNDCRTRAQNGDCINNPLQMSQDCPKTCCSDKGISFYYISDRENAASPTEGLCDDGGINTTQSECDQSMVSNINYKPSDNHLRSFSTGTGFRNIKPFRFSKKNEQVVYNTPSWVRSSSDVARIDPVMTREGDDFASDTCNNTVNDSDVVDFLCDQTDTSSPYEYVQNQVGGVLYYDYNEDMYMNDPGWGPWGTSLRNTTGARSAGYVNNSGEFSNAPFGYGGCFSWTENDCDDEDYNYIYNKYDIHPHYF